ncbi:MAG TPA: DNA-3-methyladenine glycosylase, partial [Verrucomicrobiae bacterium]
MFRTFPESFYEPTADVVARELLGHYLIRKTEEGFCGGAIVETEAYLHDDPACHAFGGRPSMRNRSMFGAPGRAYVYLIYGLHYCFNAVCRPHGHAEAILVRAIEIDYGENIMRRRRSAKSEIQLTNGPAKLCEALGIDRKLDGLNLCDANSPVFIARNSARKRFMEKKGPLVTTTRIGITKAAALPLRFYLAAS